MGPFALRVSAVLGCTLLLSCSPPPDGPLPFADRACVIGWWHGGGSACSQSIECPRQPECTAADCEAIDYLGLASDDRVFSGFMTRSSSMRKISSSGPRDASTWMLASGGMLTLRAGSAPIETRCSGDRMDTGVSSVTRYDRDLSAALDRLKGTMPFVSESY